MDCSIGLIICFLNYFFYLWRVNDSIIDCENYVAPLVPGIDFGEYSSDFGPLYYFRCIYTILLDHTRQLTENPHLCILFSIIFIVDQKLFPLLCGKSEFYVWIVEGHLKDEFLDHFLLLVRGERFAT